MKLRKWIVLALALALCAALTACGGSGTAASSEGDALSSAPETAQSSDGAEPGGAVQSGTGSETDAAEPEQGVAYEPIQMADDYTFTDPTDLDFDTRYVYMGYEECKLLSDMKNFGFDVTAMYEILYTKGGEYAGEYQYFICPDETMAADLTAYYQGQGQNVTQDGKAVYAFSDGETLLATVMTYQGMGMIPDETPESYLNFMAEFNGLVEYTE